MGYYHEVTGGYGISMGVYIRGMEMPTSCDVCPFIAEADDYHVCYINEQFIPWEWIDEHSAEQRHPKPSWCPLVEIVHCKDCRWGREVCGNIECSVDMNVPVEYHGYDWYCPNGERRAGE